jgi:DNA replication protein DnaC
MANKDSILDGHLRYLKLSFLRENHEAYGARAAQKQLSHHEFLRSLIKGEADRRKDNAVKLRIKQARFQTLKTLDQFDWEWPDKINRLQVQNLCRLKFMETHTNIILLGTTGLGKSHLAAAIGLKACQKRITTLFTTAVDVINDLTAAQEMGQLKNVIKKYIKPRLLILDELGYLPIDKIGADLLFTIISKRYETSSTIITSNRAYKDWAEIFNNDSTLTSVLLDRVLHHAETVLIEGKSYRMKNEIEI